MQKQKALLVVGASLFVIAVFLALSLQSNSGEDVAPTIKPPPAKSLREESLSHGKNGNGKTIGRSDLPTGNPEENAAPREKILEDIQDAAVTYDAAGLPKIEPYLLHQDQEIRLAAMNGMITLGDKAAGPLLRKAAASAPTPQEAVALMEAADYVELPSGKFRRRSK